MESARVLEAAGYRRLASVAGGTSRWIDERHPVVVPAMSADVVSAYDSTTALGLLGTQQIDGVLVDNGLPDLSGVEFIRLVRSDPLTLNLPLVLFTGSSSAVIEREARKAGADDFLAKPVEPVLLEERVMSLLTRETRVLPT